MELEEGIVYEECEFCRAYGCVEMLDGTLFICHKCDGLCYVEHGCEE